jgi:hypothetical protein
MNLAARLWIREERVKSDGLFEVRAIHHELVDHEFIGRHSRVFRKITTSARTVLVRIDDGITKSTSRRSE